EINPDMIEVCDGIDNDCNGIADDGITVYTYYLDTDGDAFGDAAISLDTCLTAPPKGYVSNNMDCDDINPDINPDAEEVLDSLDNNCNGMVDEGLVASQAPTATQWNVFPNPTNGQLFIQGDFRGQAIFRVIDINGRVVVEQQISMQNGEVVLSLGSIPSGVYLIECQKMDGARLFVGRVLKI
ncbi:MAG TPA: MopE-related protein, partial [Saprospiraceae bacterium]|nr:MopE-related protein [Saprospiraceae bacterium]